MNAIIDKPISLYATYKTTLKEREPAHKRLFVATDYIFFPTYYLRHFMMFVRLNFYVKSVLEILGQPALIVS
jgi:hypothetical protein